MYIIFKLSFCINTSCTSGGWSFSHGKSLAFALSSLHICPSNTAHTTYIMPPSATRRTGPPSKGRKRALSTPKSPEIKKKKKTVQADLEEVMEDMAVEEVPEEVKAQEEIQEKGAKKGKERKTVQCVIYFGFASEGNRSNS